MSISKKIILITGAAHGFGRDAAFALAKRGHRVIASTHTSEQAETLRAEAISKNIDIKVIKLDISLESDREQILTYDLDVLVNNAAVGETGPLSEVPMDRVRRSFEVNVFSTLELTQLALKGMMKKGKGTVVIMSSVAGRIPVPFLNPYSMTKFALSGAFAAMRSEIHRVAKDVHITLIEPGSYGTGFNERVVATKYEWLKEDSYFYTFIPSLKKEDKVFTGTEVKKLDSMVRKIVLACESEKPKTRYSAPFYQSFAVQMLRIFGA